MEVRLQKKLRTGFVEIEGRKGTTLVDKEDCKNIKKILWTCKLKIESRGQSYKRNIVFKKDYITLSNLFLES